jgi:hypothetical protein
VKTRRWFGLAAVACAACCIGPIISVLGAIAAIGVASTFLIGVLGVVIAAAVTTIVIVRKRLRQTFAATEAPVTVTLTTRT